jgi:hypothetical protein
MALINCKECGRSISDEAAACPGCGKPNPKFVSKVQSAPPKKRGCGCFSLIIGVIFLFFLYAMIEGTSNNSNTSSSPEPKAETQKQANEPTTNQPDENHARLNEDSDGQRAYFEGEYFCKDHLKAPRTAKFSSMLWDAGKTGYRSIDTNSWLVYGFVDSQNSFGAMLRENWCAVVSKGGDQYQVSYLEIGDQKIGSLPESLQKLQDALTQTNSR